MANRWRAARGGAALTAAGTAAKRSPATALLAAALAAVFASFASNARPALADQPPEGWKLVWADEFDGDALDTCKWNIQIGDGTAEGIPGWGNNELQSYQPGNVAVGGGHLVLAARAEAAGGRAYTSGRINTDGKFTLRYGRIEGRIRVPAGKGMWAAFWMLPSGSPYGPWPASGEIDIMEVFSRSPAPFTQGVAHYGMAWPLNVYAVQRYDGIDPADGFHVYALEWDARQLRWFVDGVHFHTGPNATYWNYYRNGATNAHEAGPESAPFDQPFHLLLNLAVGGDLPGDPAADAFPGEMRVDYVRVYRCALDGNTDVGCAGLAAPVDPAVQPTAAQGVYQAEYELYADAVVPLALRNVETSDNVQTAVPLGIHVDDAGGALALAELEESERGRVIDLATIGGGSFAVRAADSRLRLFGMGPVEGASLAGEIQFDLHLFAEGTDPASRLLVKLDSGPAAVGLAELPVAGLPTNEWTTVTVQIGELVRNSGGVVDLARVRSLFVLEPVGAVHLRLDDVRIRCGHKQPHGCGIAR